MVKSPTSNEAKIKQAADNKEIYPHQLEKLQLQDRHLKYDG